MKVKDLRLFYDDGYFYGKNGEVLDIETILTVGNYMIFKYSKVNCLGIEGVTIDLVDKKLFRKSVRHHKGKKYKKKPSVEVLEKIELDKFCEKDVISTR